MRSLRLALILCAVVLNSSGCAWNRTTEAYSPTTLSFEYEGVEYEGFPTPREAARLVEYTSVALKPQTNEGSLVHEIIASPYRLAVTVRTRSPQFDRVTFERVMIHVPDTQRRVELLHEPHSRKLLRDGPADIYHGSATPKLKDQIELDFEAEESLFLVLEYSFRGPPNVVPEYRREVIKFNAKLLYTETPGSYGT